MKSCYRALVFCLLICSLSLLYISFKIKMFDSIIQQKYYFKNSGNDFYHIPKNPLKMKYILLWTSAKAVPFVYMGSGQEGFLSRNCTYVNCFVTSNSDLFDNITKFDVIAFAGPQLSVFTSHFINNLILPLDRSVHQKYVYASIESSQNYQLYSLIFNGFFNWTWTYKLDSDLRWGYIVVRDLQNNIIGPQINMNWLKAEEMKPITEDLRAKLRKKTKIAAWIVSMCFTKSSREFFYSALETELNQHNLSIDVYGTCGTHVCETQDICDKKISEKYYFYLSFENSFSEDYVTEKLLHALNNNAIPIVFGGANYTRFMPDGIYLNAMELGPKKLASKMIELMNDPDKYAEYFRWRNHYKFERTTDNPDTNEYCRMCSLLNDEKAVKNTTVYWNFREWWNRS